MATDLLRVSSGDRRQQILDAAANLFAHQGFQGTTTRQIAARAGINEAIIFRHFPSKEDLYWAILDDRCHPHSGRRRLDEILQTAKSDAEVFATVAENILGRDTTLTRLLLFSALENHRLSQRFFRSHAAQYGEALAGYIRKGIDEGRFRDVDPLLAARGFLGMVVYHFLVQELFGGKRQQHFEPAAVSRTLTDVFLQGMLLSKDGDLPPGAARTAKPANHRRKSENGAK